MSMTDEAVAYFKEGFNCSQAIAVVYGKDLGIDHDTALKVSSGFGGGMGRMGGVCGALTGGFMVLGLKFGAADVSNKSAKIKTYELVEEMSRRFKAKTGSIYCRDILGFDLGREEGREQAKEKGSFAICPGMVRIAGRILEEILAEQGG